jgi:cell division protein FtsL
VTARGRVSRPRPHPSPRPQASGSSQGTRPAKPAAPKPAKPEAKPKPAAVKPEAKPEVKAAAKPAAAKPAAKAGPKAGGGGRRGGPGLRVPLPGGGDRRLRLTRRGLVLALIVFALSAMSVYPLRSYVIQQQRIDQLEAKQEALNAEVARLEQEKARLQDPEYVEQLAREELQMAKPGEDTYVMSGQPPADRPAPGGAEPPRRPWYLRLWDGLMGRAG